MVRHRRITCERARERQSASPAAIPERSAAEYPMDESDRLAHATSSLHAARVPLLAFRPRRLQAELVSEAEEKLLAVSGESARRHARMVLPWV